MKSIISNKKAFYDYDILKEYEAGIILEGWEVKAIKASKINITGSYIKSIDYELYLTKARVIPLISSVNVSKEKEDRDRKLLLNKNQILNIIAKLKEDRATIVPLEVYVADNKLIKVRIGIAKGKRKFEKKEKIKKRDLERSEHRF